MTQRKILVPFFLALAAAGALGLWAGGTPERSRSHHDHDHDHDHDHGPVGAMDPGLTGELPPDHPPIGGGTTSAGPLPADHPPIDGPEGLPPGHPALEPPTQDGLPPGHPAIDGTGGGAPGRDPGQAGGVAWTMPSDWTARTPSTSMRAAEFAVGEDPEPVVAVFHFPGNAGGVEANLERWIDQLKGPGGAAPTSSRARHTFGGLPVTTVEASGDYVGMGDEAARGQRLLGAIVEAPTGLVFFKLVGPAEQVSAAKPSFDAFVQSVRPAS